MLVLERFLIALPVKFWVIHGCPEWSSVVKISLKVLRMPNQRYSFTKRWKSSKQFLNHSLLTGNLKLHAISYNPKKVYKKVLWLLFMDGIQLSQGYRTTTKRQ